MHNHNKAQQSKNRVYISRDVLYARNTTTSHKKKLTAMFGVV